MNQPNQPEPKPGGNSAGVSPAVSHLIFWPIFLVSLAGDLLSKHAVFEWLGSRFPYRKSVIDGFFQIVMVENPGAAWGMAAGHRWPLIALSVAALIAVFTVFIRCEKPNRLVIVSLAFFAAGICGNLYDRIFNDGKVRDFLDFYWRSHHWPSFNLADSLLTTAVAILILVTIFSPPKKVCKQK